MRVWVICTWHAILGCARGEGSVGEVFGEPMKAVGDAALHVRRHYHVRECSHVRPCGVGGGGAAINGGRVLGGGATVRVRVRVN